MSAPARLAAVGLDEAVEVDGELVVPGPHGIHRLNPTAALVWRCCDGDASVDSLAADLSAAFDAPEPQVRADVVTIVDELVASGLVEPAGAVDAVRAALVLDPEEDCAGCGPGPDYDEWVWLRLGEHVVSVGADAEVADALAAALRPLVVRGPEAPEPTIPAPVYGVVLPAGPRERGVQELPRLHRGARVVLRSRDPERVARALLAQLAAHGGPPDLPALRCVAVGPAAPAQTPSTQLFGSGRADGSPRVVLVPEPAPRAGYERAAAAAGLAVSAASVVFVDVGADPPAVVLGAPALGAVDPTLLLAVARERLHLGAEPAPLPDGRYEVAGIAVPGAATAATALAELAPPRRGGIDPAPALTALLALIERVPVRSGTDPDCVWNWSS